MKTTFGSIFSGGGLADIGAIAAGCSPLFAVERDPDIAAVYSQNIPGSHMICAAVEDVDILWASPPCQGDSQARNEIIPAPLPEEDKCAACGINMAVGTQVYAYYGYFWHMTADCDLAMITMIALGQEERFAGWLRLKAMDDDGDIDDERWYTRKYHYFVDDVSLCAARHRVLWGDFGPTEADDFDFPSVEWQCKDCVRRLATRHRNVARIEKEWERVRKSIIRGIEREKEGIKP